MQPLTMLAAACEAFQGRDLFTQICVTSSMNKNSIGRKIISGEIIVIER